MAINPGIPIPSAIPRVSTLERSFNEVDDGVDEEVGDCMVDVGLEPQPVGTESIDGVISENIDNSATVVADGITDEDAKLDIGPIMVTVVVGCRIGNDIDEVDLELDMVTVDLLDTTVIVVVGVSMVRREENKDDKGPKIWKGKFSPVMKLAVLADERCKPNNLQKGKTANID
jgi:hypothetical protein